MKLPDKVSVSPTIFTSARRVRSREKKSRRLLRVLSLSLFFFPKFAEPRRPIGGDQVPHHKRGREEEREKRRRIVDVAAVAFHVVRIPPASRWHHNDEFSQRGVFEARFAFVSRRRDSNDVRRTRPRCTITMPRVLTTTTSAGNACAECIPNGIPPPLPRSALIDRSLAAAARSPRRS